VGPAARRAATVMLRSSDQMTSLFGTRYCGAQNQSEYKSCYYSQHKLLEVSNAYLFLVAYLGQIRMIQARIPHHSRSEVLPSKQDVEGSNPFSRSKYLLCRFGWTFRAPQVLLSLREPLTGRRRVAIGEQREG